MDSFAYRLQGSLHSIFGDRISIRKEMLELEGSERDLEFEIFRKQLAMGRIDLVITDLIAQEKV